MKLGKKEKKQLFKAIAKTFLTTIKMASILVADWMAYSLLLWLRQIVRDLTATSKCTLYYVMTHKQHCCVLCGNIHFETNRFWNDV